MEICIDSVLSAINAEKAGATRVELCGNLVEGGTTPSLGIFQVIKEKTSIPVFVMIRPRGGDFMYTDLEFEVMMKEIEVFKQHGADGFVFGILKSDGTIDKERNRALRDMCRPKPVTFHRAFDVVLNGEEALEQIIEMGFERILTSGLEPTVLEGLPNLKTLIEKAAERIIIVPVTNKTDFDSIHIVQSSLLWYCVLVMSAHPKWLNAEVKGLLLDIYGVLFNSLDDSPVAIEGSVEAVKKLKAATVPVRFCTNESQMSHFKVVERLKNLGFPIEPHEVFSPVPAAKSILKEKRLRPYTIVHNLVEEDFKEFDQTNPNCVLIGDAGENFSYEAMNEAFRVLLDHPVLYTMGYGRYYKENCDLMLDVGPFSKALEYSTNVKPVIIGKPSKNYFMMALDDMKVEPHEAVMIGDDIVGDVKGAQDCGIRGVQVRTGKYRPTDEPHVSITPDGYVNNLQEAIELILKSREN